jgi:hypothetical protein
VCSRLIIDDVTNARGRPGRTRTRGIPPMRCTATARGTGERCKLFVSPGAQVCSRHGLTEAARRKANDRITYAQLAGDDRRHPREVLLDMVHKADVITRLCEADMLAAGDGTIDVDNRAGLVDLIRTTHGLAERTITSRAYEEAAFAFTRHLEVEGQLVGTALGAAIDGLGLTEAWRAYAFELAQWTLLGEGDISRGDEPQPPDEPVVRIYDVAPRDRPALEAGSTTTPCLPTDDQLAMLDDDVFDELAQRMIVEADRREINR